MERMGIEFVGNDSSFTKSNKRFQDGLKLSTKATGTASKSIASRLGSMGSSIINSLNIIGRVADGVQAIKRVGQAAIDLAKDSAEIPGVAGAFEGLGGSIEAMRAGSLGMVTDIDLMKSFNSAAQLVSVDFAEALPDAMGYLSKVSAATGQKMDYMVDSLVKGVGRLSPMILDNLGIQVNLTEANEAYAKELGITTKEMTKAQQQTAVMNATMLALEKNTAAMPDIAGTSAQQITSLGVTMKNLKNSIGVELLPVMNAFMKPLSELATTLAPLVVEQVHKMSTWITDRLVPGIESAIQVFKTARTQVTGLIDAFKSGGASGGMSALADMFNIDLGAIKGAGSGIFDKLFGDFSGRLGGIGESLSGAFEALKAGDIKTALSELVRGWFDWQAIFPEIQRNLIGALFDLGQTLLTKLGEIFPGAGPVIEILQRALSLGDNIQEAFFTLQADLIAGFKGMFTELGPKLQAAVPNLGAILQTVLSGGDSSDGLLGILETMFADILPFVTEKVTEITAFATEMFGGMVDWFNDNASLIKDAIDATLNAIQVIWEYIWPALEAFVNAVWQNIKLSAEMWWGFFSNVFTSGLKAITGDWNGAWEDLKAGFGSLWTGITSVAKNSLQGIWDILDELTGGMLTTATEKFEEIKTTIKEKIEAVLEPFNAVWEFVRDNIIPVFEAFGEVIDAVVGLAIDVIVALITNVLIPALKDTYEQVADFLQPAFDAIGKVIQDVGGWITDKLITPLVDLFTATKDAADETKIFTGIIDGAKKGLEGIGTALGSVATFFSNFAEKVSAFELPGVLTPGSPTPMEIAMLGIGDALQTTGVAFGKMATKMSGTDAKVFDKVTSAVRRLVETFGKLLSMRDELVSNGELMPDMTAMVEKFKTSISQIIGMFDWLNTAFGYKKIKELDKTAIRLGRMWDAVMVDFSKMADQTEVTLPMMEMFKTNVNRIGVAMVTALTDLEKETGHDSAKLAAAFADIVSTVFGFVSTAIDTIVALTEYEPADNLESQLSNFTDRMAEIIPELMELSKNWTKAGIQAASEIFTASQGMVAFVKPAIDAVLAIAEYEPVDEITSKIKNLTSAMGEVVDQLQDVADITQTEALQAASDYYIAAQGVLGIVSDGVDALTELGGYTRAEGLMLSLKQFQVDILAALTFLEAIASDPATGLSTVGLEAASAFFEASKSVVALIKPGVDALASLGGYTRTSSMMLSLKQFQVDILAALTFLEAIASDPTTGLETVGMEAASAFFEASSDIVALITPGVDALTSLGEYTHTSGFMLSLKQFQIDLLAALVFLSEISDDIRTQGVPDATEFWIAAGQIVDKVSPAIDMLTALGEYTRAEGLQESIADFGTDLDEALDGIAELADRFEDEGIAKAEKFQAATQIMKDAIDAGFGVINGVVSGSSGGILESLRVFANTVMHHLGQIEQRTRDQAANLLQAFTDIRYPLRTVLSDLANSFYELTKAINSVPENPPWYLIAHSPPPLARALADVDSEATKLQGTMRGGLGMQALPMQATPQVNSTNMVYNVNINMGGQTLNNGMDQAVFAQQVRRVVTDVIRRT